MLIELYKDKVLIAGPLRMLQRRRKSGEIDQIDYEVNNIAYLQDMGAAISRSDVGKKAIVLWPLEMQKLGFLEIVSLEGEIMTIDFDDVSQDGPFVLFPDELGEY